MTEKGLSWQSTLVLLAVLPCAAVQVALDCAAWLTQAAPAAQAALWTIGLSALLGLVTWRMRAATPPAALTGTIITASLMFSTAAAPYTPWHTALVPVLAVSLLAFGATRAWRQRKVRLGMAEAPKGRSAAQVTANLGIAALVSSSPVTHWLINAGFVHGWPATQLLFTLGLAALAEAAADTVSSEIGQVIGGRPRLITTLRAVEPGSDGAISLVGTLAGVIAAAIVAGAGTWAVGGGWDLFWISGAGAVIGLLFDSLLGATIEPRGWLNNDAVNFLSTASAAGFALLLLAFRAHSGTG